MKVTGLLRHVCLVPFAGVLALCLHPGWAYAAATSESLVQSKLGGGTILNSPAPKLIQAVRESVSENPQRPAGIVAAVLSGGRADADAIAPQVTVAAIEGLGTKPSPRTVGAIVYSSAKATPTVVVDTVRAAINAAPYDAKAIVKAAVAAVPSLKNQIESAETTADSAPADNGYSKDDSKDSKDYGETAADPGLPTVVPFDPYSVYTGYYYPPLVTELPMPPPVSR